MTGGKKKITMKKINKKLKRHFWEKNPFFLKKDILYEKNVVGQFFLEVFSYWR